LRKKTRKFKVSSTEKIIISAASVPEAGVIANAEKNLKAYPKEHREKSRGHGEILEEQGTATNSILRYFPALRAGLPSFALSKG